jgi:trans-2,3-dihydro-3-hydroxyanthranilate isomerase
MKKLDYYILDVFSDQRYKGNPLAVVLANTELKINEYAAIAREFGYAETSFIKYTANDKMFNVRSFTAGGFEVGGAGHNLLGAVCLAIIKKWDIFQGQEGPNAVMMMDREIRVNINFDDKNTVYVGMMQQPATIVKTVPAASLATALGLRPEDIEFNNWLPSIVKTEVTHLMVPVKDTETLNRAISNKPLLIKAAQEFDFEGCYLFTSDVKEPVYSAECRFFNPGFGIDEDPATGSAAGPLAGYLEHHRYLKKEVDYRFLQGVQMSHPSSINVRVTDNGIWVSGSSVLVMEGQLYI